MLFYWNQIYVYKHELRIGIACKLCAYHDNTHGSPFRMWLWFDTVRFSDIFRDNFTGIVSIIWMPQGRLYNLGVYRHTYLLNLLWPMTWAQKLCQKHNVGLWLLNTRKKSCQKSKFISSNNKTKNQICLAESPAYQSSNVLMHVFIISPGTIPWPWKVRQVFRWICNLWRLNVRFQQGVPPESVGEIFENSISDVATSGNFENIWCQF